MFKSISIDNSLKKPLFRALLIRTTVKPVTTEEPLTEEPLTDEPVVPGSTPQPPSQGVCPKTCHRTYCKKRTVCSYEVIDVKSESDTKTVYNVRFLDKFKGLPSDLEETTLEVPKSNKKHKIEAKQKYVFMSNAHFDDELFLHPGVFNKELDLFSPVELAFLNKDPDAYCKRVKEKERCRIKKCVKKCPKLCEDCDDEETCEDDCRTRCEQTARYHKHRGSRRPKQVLFARTHE